MPTGNWDPEEEDRLAAYLVNRISEKASGRRENECLRNYPRDVYFIGNLRAEPAEQSEGEARLGHNNELLNKLAPVAFGAEFLLQVEGGPVEVLIALHWSSYYRVFPSLNQQRAHQRYSPWMANEQGEGPRQVRESTSGLDTYAERTYPSDDAETVEPDTGPDSQTVIENSPEASESVADRRHARTPHDSLYIRFKKIPCEAVGKVRIIRDSQGRWIADCSDLQANLDAEVERARLIALNDPERVRLARVDEEKIRTPATALVSEDEYGRFLRSLTTEIQPEWRWKVRADVWATGSVNPGERLFSVEFANISPLHGDSHNEEPFLFDTEAAISFPSQEVRPFQVDLAPSGFRHNRDMWGRGINCAIERKSGGASESIYTTTHAPVYRQMRFVTRTSPPARFSELSRDPIPILDSILNAMERYIQVWDAERNRYILEDPNWAIEHGAEYDRDKEAFEEEISRFRGGCELIRTNSDVRQAFQLTNETFRRGPKEEWRLFQIVFLVSQIAGVVGQLDPNSPEAADRGRVDIIYFPTGGGKTEAYLATIVFNCFFDRLRGKRAGVTAWTRFSLRLLTLQQTQRVADVICTAELVRREQQDQRLIGTGIDGFAVGYFVGEGGSPNEIWNPQGNPYANAEAQIIWSKANDPVARQDWKRIARCPSCRTSTVTVDLDSSKTSLIHRCEQRGCRFPGGIIPAYIVDNEIYRYLPSVLVGTIDKLAGLGNQRKFALLFGQADGRCSEHGYYKSRCCQKDCTDLSRLDGVAPEGLSGPTLFIQDELHLLKEGLGTFDGHYETFTQRLLFEYGQLPPLKIIASSATIEAFGRQVNHLYGRGANQAKVFPGLGPTLRQSFYAETLDYPQRLFAGIIPHNKTIFNSILELIEFYHREIQVLENIAPASPNPYGGALAPGSPEWKQLIDLYSTSMTYFSSNKELNSVRTDLEGAVIPLLQSEGLRAFDISELTGSTSTDDTSRILEKLERPSPPGGLSDSILATSMVSHGVDVDRLNALIFYGMPRQNAEYIQSSSRVGRSHVGIVFTCLHPIRERDQSHYSYFMKFHDFLGQMVEPVAINRWSKYSINRTLPGLFMGVLLQLVANRSRERNPNRYYMLDFVRGKISDGSLQPEQFIPFLEQAYGVQTPTTPGEVVFRDEIRFRVRQYFDWILSPSAGRSFVSDVLIPKPMRSLRDVDESIPIELDALGSHWVNMSED